MADYGKIISTRLLCLHPNTKVKFRIDICERSILFTNSTVKVPKPIIVNYSDIIGCDSMKGKKEGDTSSYLSVYCYTHKKKVLGDGTKRQRQVYTIQFAESESYENNLKDARVWKTLLTNLLKGTEIDTAKLRENVEQLHVAEAKKWLFVANPRSGPGKAVSIFKERVVPMLAEASIQFDLLVTENAGHAVELMKQLNLQDFYCVVIVSGDGLIYEVINGLMQRNDWQKAIKLPIGCLPGGSGNALCCALSHAAREPYLDAQVLHSTYLLIKHNQLELDLVALETASGKRIYSFLSVTWGLISDVDIESERFRSLGNFRFTLGALIRIAGLRRYRGQVSFLPHGKYTAPNANPKMIKRSQSDYPLSKEKGKVQISCVKRAVSMVAEGQSQQAPIFKSEDQEEALQGQAALLSVNEVPCDAAAVIDKEIDIGLVHQNSTPNLPKAATNTKTVVDEGLPWSVEPEESSPMPPTPLLVPLSEAVPDDWVVVEDEFISVFVMYLSHLGPDLILDKELRFNEGKMYLVMIHHNATRAQILKLMLQMGDGTVSLNDTTSTAVEIVPVRAFRIVPLTEKGVLAVDGELVDYGPIQGEVLPGLATVMGIEKRL